MVFIAVNYSNFNEFAEQAMQESNNVKNHSSSTYLTSAKSTTPIYGDIQSTASIPYHSRFTPSSTASVNSRTAPSHSALPFQSRRSSPSISLLQSASFSMNSPSASNSSHLSSFKQSTLSMSSPVGSNANSNYLSIASNASAATQSTALSSAYLPNQNVPTTPYTPLNKHWLWNSSLFYPQSRPIHDGFLPYPSPLGTFFGNKLRDSASQISSTNSNETIKNVDISSSSYCSDINSDSDSLDVSDHEKVSPAIAQSNQKRRILSSDTSGTTSNSPAKKRNPYSIEELLKKPEKKIRRIEPLSFQPSIIVNNDENSKTLPPSPNIESVVTDTNESFIHSDIDDNKSINNNNHITIEVCD